VFSVARARQKTDGDGNEHRQPPDNPGLARFLQNGG
jgi:hypothetical protein